MKIALVSNNGIQISPHFGRAKSFIVVTLKDGQEVARELRTKPAHQICHGGDHDHSHDQGHSQPIMGPDEVDQMGSLTPSTSGHHGAVLELISDCSVVIGGGMGMGMERHLQAAGIQPILTSIRPVNAALKAYLAGTLKHQPELVH